MEIQEKFLELYAQCDIFVERDACLNFHDLADRRSRVAIQREFKSSKAKTSRVKFMCFFF